MRNVLFIGPPKKIGAGFRPSGLKFRKGQINSLFYTIALSVLAFVGCSVGPESIQFGRDHCEYCKMTISDSKFGAELVTQKGRIYKFDAVECMVPFMMENPNEYAYIMAVAYDVPGELTPVDELQFLIADEIRSPMGANLAAFRNSLKGGDLFPMGKPYSWEDLKLYFVP